MDLSGTISGLKKLNNSNYIYWKACIESYLQGQDLWEVVGGSETTPPEVAIEATMTEPTIDPKPKKASKNQAETPYIEQQKEALRNWESRLAK